MESKFHESAHLQVIRSGAEEPQGKVPTKNGKWGRERRGDGKRGCHRRNTGNSLPLEGSVLLDYFLEFLKLLFLPDKTIPGLKHKINYLNHKTQCEDQLSVSTHKRTKELCLALHPDRAVATGSELVRKLRDLESEVSNLHDHEGSPLLENAKFVLFPLNSYKS